MWLSWLLKGLTNNANICFLMIFYQMDDLLISAAHAICVNRNGTLVFRELKSLGCINLKNFCGHIQEVLRVSKHHQLVKFG